MKASPTFKTAVLALGLTIPAAPVAEAFPNLGGPSVALRLEPVQIAAASKHRPPRASAPRAKRPAAGAHRPSRPIAKPPAPPPRPPAVTPPPPPPPVGAASRRLGGPSGMVPVAGRRRRRGGRGARLCYRRRGRRLGRAAAPAGPLLVLYRAGPASGLLGRLPLAIAWNRLQRPIGATIGETFWRLFAFAGACFGRLANEKARFRDDLRRENRPKIAPFPSANRDFSEGCADISFRPSRIRWRRTGCKMAKSWRLAAASNGLRRFRA